jgi:hypothetical protein
MYQLAGSSLPGSLNPELQAFPGEHPVQLEIEDLGVIVVRFPLPEHEPEDPGEDKPAPGLFLVPEILFQEELGKLCPRAREQARPLFGRGNRDPDQDLVQERLLNDVEPVLFPAGCSVVFKAVQRFHAANVILPWLPVLVSNPSNP